MGRPKTFILSSLLVLMAGVGGAVGPVVNHPARADPADARRTELLYMLRQDCGSCHGMTMKGGLGSPLLPEHLEGREVEDIVAVILDGIPGTPMPPWRPLLSEAEATFLAQTILGGLDEEVRP